MDPHFTWEEPDWWDEVYGDGHDRRGEDAAADYLRYEEERLLNDESSADEQRRQTGPYRDYAMPCVGKETGPAHRNIHPVATFGLNACVARPVSKKGNGGRTSSFGSRALGMEAVVE